jgi:hypothetical protein
MTQKFTASALLIAVASAFTWLRAQEIVVPDTSTLVRMTARFAPTEIGADLSKLSVADRRVVAKLVEAAKIVDALFLRQVWSGNEAMLVDLARDDSPAGRARLHYFLINKGHGRGWITTSRSSRARRPSRRAPTITRMEQRKRNSNVGCSRCPSPNGREPRGSSPRFAVAGRA